MTERTKLPASHLPPPTAFTPPTPVEAAALAASGAPFRCPDERLPVVVVDHFPMLGRTVALRFLEWARDNPEGVASLPTGKTPEHFIRWVERLRADWARPETRRELEPLGFAGDRAPGLAGIRFVQMDDFYPLDPEQENSFHHFVHRFYLAPAFGLSAGRALAIDNRKIGLLPGQTLDSLWPEGTVDLDLRHRQPRSRLEEAQREALYRIDQWCQDYEGRIRDLGGIGFFLGGIGPDGHVAFNTRGSPHDSVTRLAPANYETQAAAAADLGGMETARRRHVLTIGLATIARRPDAVAIVMAAGEAKAPMIAQAALSAADVRFPATALQAMPGARLYLTRGAAALLPGRRRAELLARGTLDPAERDRILVDIALDRHTPLARLTARDIGGHPQAAVLGKFCPEAEWPALARALAGDLARRIERGSQARGGTRFLHTEPHHDDILLGYLTPLIRHTRDATNDHWFATLTSGFTSVTNGYMARQAERARAFLDTPEFKALSEEGYFGGDPRHRERDVWQFLDGVAAGDAEMAAEGESRRFLRDMATLDGGASAACPARLRAALDELLAYLRRAYPGRKDPPEAQTLKGMRREWEVECLWGYLGWSAGRIRHLRLGFYTGDLFTPEPALDRDVPPIQALLSETRPEVVTVALDPEGAGPDTHYKTLQAVAEALRAHAEAGLGRPEIWGYRNIWHRFHPAEANCWTPVSLNMLATMEKAFLSAFASQREASFPSYAHDGPFCDLARKIQVEQYQMAKTLLGREWFQEHASPLIRAARAFTFTRAMGLDEFLGQARALRRAAEG